MEIKSLNDISPDDLYASFSEAFNDYGRSWNKTEFEKMLFRRGYVPELSFGAFDDDRLVSFTLNGIGEYSGKNTAYDTGTGTLETYRRSGLATKILLASLPHLRQAGIEQYLLEVMQTNTNALSIYAKAGFTTTRELNYFITPTHKILVNSNPLPPGFVLKKIELQPDKMSPMWDFQPSWQNTFSAILKKVDDFTTLGIYHENRLVGYGIIETATGDIPHMAVMKSFRRMGIGSFIFQELLKYNQAGAVRIINTDAQYDIIDKFLEGRQISKSGAQFEMILDFTKLSNKALGIQN